MFRVSRYMAARELRRLALEEGFLRMLGERRGARYLPHTVLGLKEE